MTAQILANSRKGRTDEETRKGVEISQYLDEEERGVSLIETYKAGDKQSKIESNAI